MAVISHTMPVPLGISRVRDKTNIILLQEVLGQFENIDLNLAHISVDAFSLHISRSRVPTAQGDVMSFDETVGGMLGENLRLTYGQAVRFNELDDSILIVTFIKEHR